MGSCTVLAAEIEVYIYAPPMLAEEDNAAGLNRAIQPDIA